MSEKTMWETTKIQGDKLLETVKKLIHEGNVRRIIIKQGDRSVAEFPLTAGVVGAVFAPVLAAIGALAALIGECTIAVERDTAAPEPVKPEPAAPEAAKPEPAAPEAAKPEAPAPADAPAPPPEAPVG